MLGYLSNILAAAGNVQHEVTQSPGDIPAALARMAAAGVDVIGVNGGDGSVALVLGCLLGGASPFAAEPLICALPGGTTNVTVGDVGVEGALDTAFMRLLAWRNGRLAGQELQRPVIGVRNAHGTVLGCGLVFGAGAVVTGIEYWQESVRARGMRSEYSSGVAMVRTVWGMLRGHERFAAPVRIHLDLPGEVPIDGDFMLLAVCTLERLFLGIHPFWGSGTGALKVLAVERGARGFAAALPAILAGKEPAQARHGAYHSARVEKLGVGFHGSYTMDGELHTTAPEDAPLEVYTAGHARFLRI